MELTKRKSNSVLCNEKYIYVNPEIKHSYNHVASSIYQFMENLKHPTEKTVRDQLLIVTSCKNTDCEIAYKNGGESNADSLFECAISGLIEDPKTGNDKKIVYYKKYGKTLKEVLFDFNEVYNAIKHFEEPNERYDRIARFYVGASIEYYRLLKHNPKKVKGFNPDTLKTFEKHKNQNLNLTKLGFKVFEQLERVYNDNIDTPTTIEQYNKIYEFVSDEHTEKCLKSKINYIKDIINPALRLHNFKEIEIN